MPATVEWPGEVVSAQIGVPIAKLAGRAMRLKSERQPQALGVRRPGPCRIEDLDDGCLLAVFSHLSPLPDLFNVAAVCQRFRHITMDGRLWLLVSGALAAKAGGEPISSSGRRCRVAYATLQEAVHASRPGDTIVLEAGEEHVAGDVALPWPLHLVGGGAQPEDTQLLCARGAEAALDFRASGKVANLSVRSRQAACILHRCGRVTVEGCLLQCDPEGLDHLFTPLVTLACSWAHSSRGASSALGFSAANSQPGPAGPLVGAAGEGVLAVVETKIHGGRGQRAVRTGGSGALRGVRVIHLRADALFWFHVDSARPGPGDSSAAPGLAPPLCAPRAKRPWTSAASGVVPQPAPSPWASAAGGTVAKLVAPPAPSWAAAVVKLEEGEDAGADAIRRHAAVMDIALARAKEWYALRRAAWDRGGRAPAAEEACAGDVGGGEPAAKRRRL